MDAKWVNAFIEAFINVMSQIGFQEIKKTNVNIRSGNIQSSDVIINSGITGDIKGNVVYSIELENAKKLASKMMMGAPVSTLDDMAKSAISELANMITSNASTNFGNMSISTSIAAPILTLESNYELKLDINQFICIEMLTDNISVELMIAIQNN